MGNTFTRALGSAKRKVMNYNIEERAFKAMDKQKTAPIGKAAPKYPTKTEKVDGLENEYEEFMDEQKKKDEKLVGWMQKIALSRTDGQVKPESPIPHLSKEGQPEFEYGFQDPEVIPEGRCTIQQALAFIYKHQQSKEYTMDNIVQEYKLNPQDVQNVLTHFKAFKLHVPRKLVSEMPELRKALSETKYNQPPKQYAKITGGIGQKISDPMK